MKIYSFEEGASESEALLGGKGSGLAEMTRIGMPVPPGFIITTEVCRDYMKRSEKAIDNLDEEILQKIREIERKTGKKFGDPSNPLLVSVRSGAPVSMPGMMDTVLNLGLNDETVKGLIKQTGNERFAYDAYRRLVQMYGRIVLGMPGRMFEERIERYSENSGVNSVIELDAHALKKMVDEFKELVRKETGKEFPDNPFMQLKTAIGAVFRSWNGKRAKTYRQINKIPDDLGTAVNVQTMVFGNMGPDSGSGVGFTRDPSTGEKKMYGEYLLNSQGEDVVSGSRTPKHIDQLQNDLPSAYKELTRVCETLEKQYKDVQDFEFTVEKGKLYMLQTRTGKRTAEAAVKIAVDMVKEGLIAREEAIMRVESDQLNQLLHRRIDPEAKANTIAEGLPASPGAASGRVVFDTDEAAELGNRGEKVILVRPETTPEDIHGMVAAQGTLTSRGGMTSHAAVVARGMGKPCVCGCSDIRIDLDDERFYSEDFVIKKGEVITLDGGTGRVMLGEVPTVEPELSGELVELLKWADEVKTLEVRANTDTPEGATKAREFGAQGIGLCRTERMFNAQDRLPIVQDMILAASESERKEALHKLLPMQRGDFKEVLQVMDGFPVCIRLLDLPLHEFLPEFEDLLVEVTTLRLRGADKKPLEEKEMILKRVRSLREHNPMLGHRGCRLGIFYPEIYEMQTQAIFEAATELCREGLSVELEIMIPLVSEANELRFLREKLEQVAEDVMRKTAVVVKYSFGTMIEVPRAALTADEIAKYAEFFSFGTNDLTQTTWGYSRDDAEAKFLHDYLNKKIVDVNPFEIVDRSGVGKLIKTAIELGKKTRKDLKLGICGEHGGEPNSIEFCHQVGLDYVSCSPFRVPVARLAAAQAKIKWSK